MRRYPLERHPFSEVNSLRDQMDRFFENLPYENFMNFRPSIDVFEKDGNVIVEADIPGINPDDIEIAISEDRLNIKGKVEKNEEVKEDNYYRTERQFGSFNRNINLPARVNHKKAEARVNNGVLKIKIPKMEHESEKITRLRPH
ncbi:Hsp20/alpha crystallin family protein [Halothermothrix orenii]|uniref:Heat shock protein Hsp20 n=1 Tax=Halothermothrix orenii (strain H 168 / OCM 544 / DSM 9562) TaxID=373903 RepID=B8CY41_HALOH|nr:Hsp20/alpha crystallin family protein [Halothermothrix orenii]ACL70210.1 heat shock protein Hsp20 [Halothermothrix orenii H 168]